MRPSLFSISKRKLGLRFLVLLFTLCCAAFLTLTWIASSRLICPPRRPLQDYHQHILSLSNYHGLIIQPYSVSTSDGLDTPCLLCEPSKQPGPALKGRKVRDELQAQGIAVPPWGEMKATLVLLHGHKGRKEDHLPIAERLCASGFRCILIDLPGHGDHPAPFATFGVREASLPHEVLHAAAKRFAFNPQPAGLFGISQGGAIALQSAARQGESWFAVGELSCFASLDDVIATEAQRLFGPLHQPAHAMVHWLVKLRAGFTPDQSQPLNAAALLPHQSVLIGHGDRDNFIACDHAHLLFSAIPSPQKYFLNVPGAGHHNVLATSAPVYATVGRFFLNALPPPER
jgi:acetyl esterase/lipase